jgi:hypothetical protein
MRAIRVIFGAVVWLGVIVTAAWWATGWTGVRENGDLPFSFRTPDLPNPPQPREGSAKAQPRLHSAGEQLWRYLSAGRSRVELEMSRPVVLAVGDPIFVFQEDGAAIQVGEVARVADSAGAAGKRWTTAVAGEAILYPQAPPLAPGARLDYYTTPDSLEWVVETMLPPHKQRQIALEISGAFQEHQEEILAALRPVVEASFRDAVAVVEQDLPLAVERHRPALEKLGDRYRGDLVARRLTPLVRQEIWPMVQRRAEPLAEEIGLEIWQRASLWRFGWRYAYDISPLPQKNLTEYEWRRFLQQEAIPVVEQHTDDLIRLQQQIVRDVARNERVQRVVRQTLVDITNDPEVQRLAWAIFRDALLENERLRETLERHWRSDEAQRAMTIAAERLEPTARRIGDLLFGTKETGISPEFARVLRSQILHKDRRWLVLHTPAASESERSTPSAAPHVLLVRPAHGDGENPFYSTRSAGNLYPG